VSQSATTIDESLQVIDRNILLPVGWRWLRLREICHAIRGVTFSSGEAKAEPFTNSVACLTTSGVQDVVAWDSRRYIPKQRVNSHVQMLHKNDLLVSTANSKALVGKSCLVDEPPFECTFGAFVTVLRPTSDVEPYLLESWLRTTTAKQYCYEKSSNTTNISNLRVEDLLALEIPLPLLPEQKRIAAILRERLAAAERARVANKFQLKAAESLSGAYLREAFLGITPLTVNPVYNEAPEGWRWHKLTDLARLESGHTPSRYHPEWWGGDIPWIALPDIRALDGKVAYETSEHTNPDGIANSAARILPAGTVVLSRTASVGFVTIMGRPMATSQDFVNWVCGDELDPHFLALLLRASRKFIHSVSSGAVHKTVYMPTVESFRVCIPSLDEQRRIATDTLEKLQHAEKLVASLTDNLKAIGKLPAALLRQAFSGKL
jgi:type I restriction enzyme S subunit